MANCLSGAWCKRTSLTTLMPSCQVAIACRTGSLDRSKLELGIGSSAGRSVELWLGPCDVMFPKSDHPTSKRSSPLERVFLPGLITSKKGCYGHSLQNIRWATGRSSGGVWTQPHSLAKGWLQDAARKVRFPRSAPEQSAHCMRTRGGRRLCRHSNERDRPIRTQSCRAVPTK